MFAPAAACLTACWMRRCAPAPGRRGAEAVARACRAGGAASARSPRPAAPPRLAGSTAPGRLPSPPVAVQRAAS